MYPENCGITAESKQLPSHILGLSGLINNLRFAGKELL